MPRLSFFWASLEQIGIVLIVPICVLQNANAQSAPVHQVGHPTRGHMTMFMGSGLLGDAGGSLKGELSSLGIVPSSINTLPPFCINDSPISNPSGYHEVCISADALGAGGMLSYSAIGDADNDQFTMRSASTLGLKSSAQQIELANLPQTVSGDVPVCVNLTTGQLYQAPAVAQMVVLTDDSGTHLLTDDSGAHLLTATIPADQCTQQ